ncbi:MAG: group II intron reverse transcriptase/maturase [Oscillospiraceae bacterium]|jgi:group II intron reverse transcriptase/maturase|nr:group II intron reverse transcriptase/maturase [Oscillospiraceae bacterium]
MTPTIEILGNINQNSAKNKDEVFTRLYRYMLRPDLYFIAYKNLYANNGAATKGVDNDTADGFGEEKINKIIDSLRDGTYQPKPVRRTYIEKKNGKLRPLGIPTFTDKLVQEVLKMILEAVYEPTFEKTSHGFRHGRSCHTALSAIKKEFTGIKWFIEGDIKGCFDNINHNVLVGLINSKIKDMRLIKLIWKFLKAGYMENWKYNETYSGCPQGGIVSPILSNICLHELDKFVMKLAQDFYKPYDRKYTDEYYACRVKAALIRRKINKSEGEDRQKYVEELRVARAEMLKTPSKSQTDKKIRYIRYADDFLIGVNGNKEECVEIKRKLTEFIATFLKMELSEEKTLITHSSEKARFLGYDVSVRRSGKIKKGTEDTTQRTLNNTVDLSIPLDDKIIPYLFNKKAVIQKNGELKPMHRKYLLNCTDFEIVTIYNAELRGLCNYYHLASNFCKISYFAYLMEYSCLKTLCNKHKTSIAKFITKHRYDKKWGIPYSNKKGKQVLTFANYADSKKCTIATDFITREPIYHSNNKTTFESRLSAKKCEICGTTTAESYEIHHVNKVKNLKGKEPWKLVMIAKKRKTLALCKECHYKIHGRVLRK